MVGQHWVEEVEGVLGEVEVEGEEGGPACLCLTHLHKKTTSFQWKSFSGNNSPHGALLIAGQ